MKLSYVKFLLKSLMSNKSIFEKKVKILPFFISILCWNGINKKSIKKDMRKMENCKTNHILDRSSYRRCSIRKVFLEISQNSRESTCARVSFLINFIKFIKVIKKRLWHICFPVNFAKFLRTPFLQNTYGRLLLFRVNRVSDHYARSIS